MSTSVNWLLDTDPQQQDAASPQVLRSGQRQRLASQISTMISRTIAAVIFASAAMPAAAQVITVLMSRSLVGGIAAPELKVTLWAVAKQKLHLHDCSDLVRQIGESMTDRQRTIAGCTEGVSEEFAPISKAEPLLNAHYVTYTDPQFANLIGKFFAVYHHPSHKYNCRYLLDRFHSDHSDATCMASK